MYLHHLIFAVVTWILLKSCSAGLTTVVLIGQELSTPFLNTFLLLRAYRGMGSLLTQGTFLLFALLFFATRVFMNSYGTFYFIREVYRNQSSFAPSTLAAMTAMERYAVVVALIAGSAMQIYWARTIAGKIYGALSGKPKEGKRKAA